MGRRPDHSAANAPSHLGRDWTEDRRRGRFVRRCAHGGWGEDSKKSGRCKVTCARCVHQENQGNPAKPNLIKLVEIAGSSCSATQLNRYLSGTGRKASGLNFGRPIRLIVPEEQDTAEWLVLRSPEHLERTANARWLQHTKNSALRLLRFRVHFQHNVVLGAGLLWTS